MILGAFHETRFGAQAHEVRRAARAWPAHETLGWQASHERRARRQLASLPAAVGSAPTVRREPLLHLRHAAPQSATAIPASEQPAAPEYASLTSELSASQPSRGSGAPAAAHQSAAGSSHADHGQGHHRSFIHARHLARMRWRQELREYHLELRHLRHLLVDRATLLRKLASIEERLARRASAPLPHHLPLHVYEIDGAWFRQAGRRRPTELKAR
jgi:hypothetical protein